MSVEAAKNARELLLKEYRGVLSTHSKSMPGFPFGSVVPYCLDEQGRPLILISRIAQHLDLGVVRRQAPHARPAP